MSNFRDYDIRVWGDSVFINSENISYVASENSTSYAINSMDDSKDNHIISICHEIREQMLKLDELLNRE